MIEDGGRDPTAREIMELLHAETAMFLVSIERLGEESKSDETEFVSYLLQMLHLATATWGQRH